MEIRKRLTPVNFNKGRLGMKPIAIVLHIMEGSLSGTDQWFKNPKAQASTHYGVGKNGEIWQWVEETDMAYGNGRTSTPTWDLITDKNPNLYTISIEHEGFTGQPWTEAMQDADAFLIADIAKRWGIPLDRDHVIGHCEIYGKKPNCPGTGLDWKKLMARLNAPQLQGVCVKTSDKPDIFWIDFGGISHKVKSWDAYQEFFKGDPKIVSKETIASLTQGKDF